jgi:hypothetical protein
VIAAIREAIKPDWIDRAVTYLAPVLGARRHSGAGHCRGKAHPISWSIYGPVTLTNRSKSDFRCHPRRVVSISYKRLQS